jgi:lipopolysaccharide/colanic/teichoic acid biosynthesis glycosyltransferase
MVVYLVAKRHGSIPIDWHCHSFCLFLGYALLIALESPGAPVIFTQMRTGKGGNPFKMYKFRSMVPNAEAIKTQLAHLNELQWPDFKITNDPRITRTGKFLRKTSLDELPQLINVLKGDMSLVGPRPTSFSASTASSGIQSDWMCTLPSLDMANYWTPRLSSMNVSSGDILHPRSVVSG